MACPDPETVQLLIAGGLDDAARRDTLAHAASCPDCRGLLVELARDTVETAPGRTEPAPLPETIDRYVVESRLGQGGMGVVYQAHDPELGRKVALKLVRLDRGSDTAAARLRREARALAQLAHPNVVVVHDVGEHDGRLFIAMERVDGGNLRDWIAARPRTWREVLVPLVDAGRGLAAAHAAGLLHRDIKPDNILIGVDGRARVTDFGLATATGVPSGDDETLTHESQLVGTPAYLAPEQIEGRDPDPRTDQWSFAITLYEVIYGRRPFAGREIGEILHAILTDPVPPPPRGRAPRWLGRVILRGLARDPEARWPSMAALVAALERGMRRRRALVIGAIAAAAAAIAIVLFSRGHSAPRPCDASIPDAVWSPARRAALAPPAAAAADRFVAAWSAMRLDTCRANQRGAESDTMRDRRTHCLDARLAGLDALLGGTPGPEALERLSLDACTGAAILAGPAPPSDPAAAARVDAARADVLRAEAFGETGRVADAAPLLDHARAEAAALAYPSLEAAADLADAQRASQAQDGAAAAALLRKAIDAAEAGGDDRAKAEATVMLVGELSSLHQFTEAHQWADHATAAIARLGGDANLSAELDDALGRLLVYEGRAAEAIAPLQHDVDARAPDSIERATALELLADALRGAGRTAEAAAPDAEASQIFRTLYGDDFAAAMSSTSYAALLAGDIATALADDLRRLAAITRLAPDNLLLRAAAETQVANDELIAGDDTALIAHDTRAVALRDQAGDRSIDLADALAEIGGSWLVLGKPADALVAFTRAAEVATALGAPGAEELAEALAGQGRAQLALGDLAAAKPLLERALTWREANAAAPNRLASVRFALAQVAWPDDPARARSLAQQARADLASVLAGLGDQPAASLSRPHLEHRIAEVGAWLAAHSGK